LKRTDAQSRFDAVVWPHAATVLRTARYLVHDPAAAEDIAQETMVKAFRSIDSFQDGTDAKAWLMTILRNTRVDYLRSRASRHGETSLESMTHEPAGVEDVSLDAHSAWENPQALLQQFSDQHMIEALQGLPEEIRWTLLLVDVEGMDQADAAKVLEVPVGTVKSRAHRGRAMLRAKLLPLAKELRLIHD